jgi:hypothetical protein
MLQELTAQTGATTWAIASLLFFLGIWLVITVRVFRTPDKTLEARARLVLEGDGGSPTENPSDAGTKA